jgi:hypothetical protein
MRVRKRVGLPTVMPSEFLPLPIVELKKGKKKCCKKYKKGKRCGSCPGR